MIERNFKKYFQQLADDELKSNLLAQIIATFYDDLPLYLDHNPNTSEIKKLYESLQSYYRKHKNFEGLPKVIHQARNDSESLKSNRDFRISSIRLKNVRGIPEKDDGLPFGFDFKTAQEDYCSAVIVGSNSSGKSSIFSAIEYVYAKEVGEAKIRTSEDLNDQSEREKYYMDYLRHFSKTSSCIIKTHDGSYTLEKSVISDLSPSTVVNPETHFISDFDIQENGKLSYNPEVISSSFHNFVAKKLGLSEYLGFKFCVGYLSKYKRLTESSSISKNLKEKNNLSDQIRTLNEALQLKKGELETARMDHDSISGEETSKAIRSNLEPVQGALRHQLMFNFSEIDLLSSMNQYVEHYTKLKSLVLEKLSKDEVQFLSFGLKLLEHAKDCPFCLSSRKDLKTITDEVNLRVAAAGEYFEQSNLVTETFSLLVDYLNRLKAFLVQVHELLMEDYKSLSRYQQLTGLLQSEREESDVIFDLLNTGLFRSINQLDTNGAYATEAQNELYNLCTENKTELISLSQLLVQLQALLIQRRDALQSFERELSLGTESQDLTKRIGSLESEIRNISSQIQTAESRIKQLDQQIEQSEGEQKLFRDITADADVISKLLTKKIDLIVNDQIEPLRATIHDVLKDYLLSEGVNEVDLKIEKKKVTYDEVETEILLAELVSKNSGERISPNKYFNTFRYRLFCSMVSCGIAIASRMSTGINLPIVFDDIFYTGDYKNRASFVKFLKTVIGLFEKFTPDIPLQFILFTHDTMIFDAAKKAIGSSHARDIFFAKLYPHNMLEKAPDGDESDKFWNLIYKIPIGVENSPLIVESQN